MKVKRFVAVLLIAAIAAVGGSASSASAAGQLSHTCGNNGGGYAIAKQVYEASGTWTANWNQQCGVGKTVEIAVSYSTCQSGCGWTTFWDASYTTTSAEAEHLIDKWDDFQHSCSSSLVYHETAYDSSGAGGTTNITSYYMGHEC